MKRTLLINVDRTTWPNQLDIPPQFPNGRQTQEINLLKAFIMLGNLTMPHLLSPASPARFWAWLRYFLAPTADDDLRITMDFSSLDPHQKGILSDDFGVALSTQWLFDRLGGFSRIVDGRRFMMHFSHLLPAKTKVAKAKVGPTKAPDFVIQDKNGKWHVLECKGTQSGRGARNLFLRKALSQKNMIRISGGLRGQRLAIGLSLSNEESLENSELKIIDPSEDPSITLDETQKDSIEMAAQRLSTATAFGIVGLSEMAAELAMPAEINADSVLLRSEEIFRVKQDRTARRKKAKEQLSDRELNKMNYRGVKYEGREINIEQSALLETPLKRIHVKQGLSSEVIETAESIVPQKSDSSIERTMKAFGMGAAAMGSGVEVKADGNHATITYGGLLYSSLDIEYR